MILVSSFSLSALLQMERAIQETAEYCRQRKAFGQSILDNQVELVTIDTSSRKYCFLILLFLLLLLLLLLFVLSVGSGGPFPIG